MTFPRALTTYSYDANGNLLAEQKPYAGTTTFTWGYENELLTSLEPDGDLVTMTYDGDLQRRQRVAGATEINFLWDREQVLMELNAAGATAARYTLAPFGYGDLVSQRRWGVSSFYHFDALGTTRRVTAADESTQLTYVRDAFGVGIASTGTTTNRFRYLGKLGYVQEDTLAGALLRRRYYQYEIGRFVSRDPLRDPGRSEYGYVSNRPTRGVDPSGLFGLDDPMFPGGPTPRELLPPWPPGVLPPPEGWRPPSPGETPPYYPPIGGPFPYPFNPVPYPMPVMPPGLPPTPERPWPIALGGQLSAVIPWGAGQLDIVKVCETGDWHCMKGLGMGLPWGLQLGGQVTWPVHKPSDLEGDTFGIDIGVPVPTPVGKIPLSIGCSRCPDSRTTTVTVGAGTSGVDVWFCRFWE
jgi:RHS repeat-associated protein